MSLSEVVSNVFSRQRARMESQRVEDTETEDVMVNQGRRSSASARDEIVVVQDVENGSTGDEAPPAGVEVARESSGGSASTAAVSNPNQGSGGNQEPEASEEDEQSPADEAADRLFATNNNFTRNTMTLAELEEQRELSRRRSSACVLLAVFVLFRLWIECLQKQEPPLLLLCLLGTAWTARWIRYNQEREEELDRRIEAYLQNSNNPSGNEEVMERSEYARLSFQAQLALAIMESQRHMMEGGYGNPDGHEQTPGVSDEAKTRWKNFQWNACGEKGDKKGEYGAVPTKGLDHVACEDVEHQCSICLCEYEEDEKLVRLPCGHVFHADCIDSWTRNHTRCPLCNLDLESAQSEGARDSIV
mmetsp:Transcript_13955/g.30522  ORF Transcript_13955/g.30522 Transcript_13955/m.30522 type:complete len:360 (-) Transcript_13955:118-1197(-)